MILFICIIIFTVVQSSSTKLFSRINNDSAVFNKIKSATAFLIFALMSISGFRLHTGTIFCGCLFGFLLYISMQTGYMALASGPMALTSMIVSFSVVIPVIYGICFRNETLGSFKIIGIVFFVAALIFTNINNVGTVRKNKADLKWGFFTAATFIANGFSSVLQKIHQEKYNSEYCLEFMFFAMLVCFILFIPLNCKQLSAKKLIGAKGREVAVLSGVANALTGYLTIKLAGFESASVLFPAISAGTILCTLAAGVIVFKEKLKHNHIIAFIFGIAAVVFLKL